MIAARQDEVHLKRQKLDYVEITPCLKEVSRVWEEMLTNPNRASVKFDCEKLLSCVKEGILLYFQPYTTPSQVLTTLKKKRPEKAF